MHIRRETPKFFLEHFISVDSVGVGSYNPLYYIVVFAPLGLGLLIQMAYKRLSFGLLIALFIGYSVLMGLGLSAIMLRYAAQDIAITFFSAAGAFGGMAVLGFTTNTDLTKFGSLMYMGFIGIFVAGMVNWFIGSEMIDFWISVIGVFVFYWINSVLHATVKESVSRQYIKWC